MSMHFRDLTAQAAADGAISAEEILTLRGAGWAEQQFKLNSSKMPIPGQGKVDLSEFEKFMK